MFIVNDTADAVLITTGAASTVRVLSFADVRVISHQAPEFKHHYIVKKSLFSPPEAVVPNSSRKTNRYCSSFAWCARVVGGWVDGVSHVYALEYLKDWDRREGHRAVFQAGQRSAYHEGLFHSPDS